MQSYFVVLVRENIIRKIHASLQGSLQRILSRVQPEDANYAQDLPYVRSEITARPK